MAEETALAGSGDSKPETRTCSYGRGNVTESMASMSSGFAPNFLIRWSSAGSVRAGSKHYFQVATGIKARPNLHLRTGQRIRCYRIDAREDGEWREVAAGESVGRRRIQRLRDVNTDCLRLRVLDGDLPLNIRSFASCGPTEGG
jgi:hypothetical protein